MKPRLDGRVAVVTGAGHGIGKAYARRLAEEGAAVVIAELDGAAARSAADEMKAAGLNALAAPTDVADAAATDAMAKAAVDAFGRIDILVNNAAIFNTVPMSRVPFDQISPSEWDKMMAVNLGGIWNACRAVVPSMRANRYGKIVNISSSTVFERTGTRIHYVTSKAGVIGFTRTLAVELGPEGICVNCIAPGSTLSEENPDENTVRFRSAAAASRALARLQKPEDLVGAVAFFASLDSDFITGQTLVVDGGSVFH
jgi:3-oxoacyl-[acyl-carrier protein] reductase